MNRCHRDGAASLRSIESVLNWMCVQFLLLIPRLDFALDRFPDESQQPRSQPKEYNSCCCCSWRSSLFFSTSFQGRAGPGRAGGDSTQGSSSRVVFFWWWWLWFGVSLCWESRVFWLVSFFFFFRSSSRARTTCLRPWLFGGNVFFWFRKRPWWASTRERQHVYFGHLGQGCCSPVWLIVSKLQKKNPKLLSLFLIILPSIYTGPVGILCLPTLWTERWSYSLAKDDLGYTLKSLLLSDCRNQLPKTALAVQGSKCHEQPPMSNTQWILLVDAGPLRVCIFFFVSTSRAGRGRALPEKKEWFFSPLRSSVVTGRAG